MFIITNIGKVVPVTLVPIAVKDSAAVPIYKFKAKMMILASSGADNNDCFHAKKVGTALIL